MIEYVPAGHERLSGCFGSVALLEGVDGGDLLRFSVRLFLNMAASCMLRILLNHHAELQQG